MSKPFVVCIAYEFSWQCVWALQLRSHVENLATLSKCNPHRRSKVKVLHLYSHKFFYFILLWNASDFNRNLCLQELSSEVVDSNPYSRLMALQRMGIVDNYERIREFSVAIVVRVSLLVCFLIFSLFIYKFVH